MQVTAFRWVLAIALGIAAASPGLAHFGVALLTIAEGGVTRVHRGAPASTVQNASLMDGDEIATTEGRAEVTFRDGTIVHLDTFTRVIVRANEKVSVLDGRVIVRTSGIRSYLTDTPAGNTRVQPASVAELTVKPEPRDALVRVINGSASVECNYGNTAVAAYYTAHVTGASCRPIVSQWIPPAGDDFERWATTRIVTANSTPAPPYAGYWWYYGGPSYVYYPYYYRPVYVAPYYYSPYTSYTPYYSSYSPYYSSYSSYATYPSYWSGAYSYYGGNYPYSYSYSLPARGISTPIRGGGSGFVPPTGSGSRPTPQPVPAGPSPARGSSTGVVVRPPQ
jgi:hypothetical protein